MWCYQYKHLKGHLSPTCAGKDVADDRGFPDTCNFKSQYTSMNSSFNAIYKGLNMVWPLLRFMAAVAEDLWVTLKQPIVQSLMDLRSIIRPPSL